ncbi:MAG: hypothetical protein CR991_02075 [Proteobacteria bacterium]|nr:MAG: hypothetical protein CR991_02075 [Pseudomonadota bacterium]
MQKKQQFPIISLTPADARQTCSYSRFQNRELTSKECSLLIEYADQIEFIARDISIAARSFLSQIVHQKVWELNSLTALLHRDIYVLPWRRV